MERSALQGLRVVEVGGGIASAYAAKLLADLGAEAVKVEPPGGDPARRFGPFPGGTPDPEASGLFLYLNANKRGVVLDVDAPEGRESLGALLDRADLLVLGDAPADLDRHGLSPDRLRERRERLVVTAVTPFGLDGPHRDWRAEDLTLWNAGGLAFLNGGGPGSDDLPPLRTFGHQAFFQAGLNAAIASLGALRARRGTGRGQTVDVSAQACLVAIAEFTYAFWPYCQMIASRLGAKPIAPLDFLACKDGWVFLCIVEEHQWRSFVEFMGSPEWAQMDIFSDRLQRGANWDVLKPMLSEWMAEQTVAEVYAQLQRRRVPIAPVSTMGDLWSSEHLNRRGFFVSFHHPRVGERRQPGAPYVLSATPWKLRRSAPVLGEHTAEVLAEVGAAR